MVNAQRVSLPSLTEMPWWMCLLAVLSCPSSRCVKAMSLSYHWTINAFFRRFFLSTAAYHPCCSCAFRLLFSRDWVSPTCIQSPEVISVLLHKPLLCNRVHVSVAMRWTGLWKRYGWKILQQIFGYLSAGCFPPSPHSCRKSWSKRMWESSCL